MRTLCFLLTAAGAAALAAPAAAQPKAPVKYTLMIVAGASGANQDRRDPVAMGGAGVFLSREDCEAAGEGVKFGVVSQPDGEPKPTIFWICVPLNKP